MILKLSKILFVLGALMLVLTTSTLAADDFIKANISGIFNKFELFAGIIFGVFLVIYIVALLINRKKCCL